MARRRIGDPELRPLIDRLVRLFLDEGTVNGVQRRLSDELADDRSEGYIHANRIHAILSEDPDRSINPSTVAAIETAVDRLAAPSDAVSPLEEELRAKVSTRWLEAGGEHSHESSRQRARAISSDIGVPAAVVGFLAGEVDAVDGPTATVGGTLARRTENAAPDWSFQDDALKRCVAALEARPDAKVGLVLPTGGGKTRVAMRILLQMLTRSKSPTSQVLWVTHRTQLHTQASRELQRAMTSGTPDLPAQATQMLAHRVNFCMIGRLKQALDDLDGDLALVVVDEAHHAAAASYQPLFENGPIRGVFLTATPNRTDEVPIGIDEIAYSTTYRELFDRGVVIEPKLGQITIAGFDWEIESAVDELADYLLEEAEDTFSKTLVAVSRVSNGTALHDALVRRRPADHVLDEEDIGSVGGGMTSSGLDTQAFLDEFGSKPRGILIATSQLLGEGFDDPSVDTAVITYETSSIASLMQVAGRCMRYAPDKTARVIQVRDSALAYHWEQGWLYQDISDSLHPRLETVAYGSTEDLVDRIRTILKRYNVDQVLVDRALAEVETVSPGASCSMLLTGLPYYGRREDFDRDATWNALLVTPETRDDFLRVFNTYSNNHEEVVDRKTYLEGFLAVEPTRGSRWSRYIDMLAAMSAAGSELRGEQSSSTHSRPSNLEHGTTYLRYFSFEFQPTVSPALDSFLADAINRDEILAAYMQDSDSWAAVAKVDLPLGGSLACLAPPEGVAWAIRQRENLRVRLESADRTTGFAVMAAWRSELAGNAYWPQFILDRFEQFVTTRGWESRTIDLRKT